MCELATVSALVAIGTTVAGTAMKANADAAAGRAERAQALFNRGLARKAAADAQARGTYEAGLLRQRGSRTIAMQRAAAGASGLDSSTGSIADVSADTRLMAELDAVTTANNAAREAWGYEMQAFQYGQGAEVSSQRATQAMTGHLLTGVSQTGTTMLKFGE